jgi:hypothetical protein
MWSAPYYEIDYAGRVLASKRFGSVVVLSFFACSGGERRQPAPKVHSLPPVRRDPWIAQVLQPPRPATRPLDVVVSVVGAQHCGGAMVQADAPGPPITPAANATVLVVAGSYYDDRAKVKQVTSDKDGAIQLDVPPGPYCIVLGERGSRPPDNSCELAEWEACSGVVTVPVTEVMAVHQHTPCWDPCNMPASPPPSMMVRPQSGTTIE